MTEDTVLDFQCLGLSPQHADMPNGSTASEACGELPASVDTYYEYFSKELYWIFYITINAVLTCISCVGVMANIVNIIVYVRIGVRDSITISFLALAVSDLFCLLTLLWIVTVMSPLLITLDTLPFHPVAMYHVPGGWGHVNFARLTGFLTVLILTERCLCVVYPMKVGRIFTIKKTQIIIISAYILVVVAMVPALYANQYGWRFSEEYNRTIIMLYHPDNYVEVESVSLAVLSVGMQFVWSFMVAASTIVLIVSLKRKTRWRQKASSIASPAHANNLSSRDKKVSRMVVFISTIYIACFVPGMVCSVAMAGNEEFSMFGQQRQLFLVYWSTNFILESINSSVNLLVYYNMSTKYRETFFTVFCCREKNKIQK